MRRALLLAPIGMTLLFGPLPALAQFTGAPAAQQNRPPPGPVALPGIAARPAPQPIPGDPNADLAPTDALFDAINRGDLPAARAAMNRGASLDERNVLGMTAIESAVDQGRNDILFFLLSARGTVRGNRPAEAGLTPRQRAQREREARQQANAAARAIARQPRGPAPVTRPRLFGNDGGAPQPDIGFLGFDAGREAGARRGG